MMIGFCWKSVDSFFNLHMNPTTSTDFNLNASPAATGKCGLGLITDPPRPRNVIINTLPAPPPVNKDPAGSLAFQLDDIIGSGGGGLTSCTETLGSESAVETQFDAVSTMDLEDRDQMHMHPSTWRGKGEKRREKKFPPPLSSMSSNGRPSFYLRPVRRGGRLELTEVRIQLPEMLTAHREDGRLRLKLVQDDCFCITEEVEEDQEKEEEDDAGEDQKAVAHVEEGKRNQLEAEEGGSEGECWGYKWLSGEAARRCEEAVRIRQLGRDHPHHNNLHVCVQTR